MTGSGHRRWIAVWLALLALLLLAGDAAAETLRGRRIQLPAGETVHGDLVADGGTVELYGDVAGDLTVRAGFVNQVGDVGGNVAVRAGRAELRGTVGGSVRAAGASLSLYGTVAGDVELTGGQLTLVEGAVVAGDVTVRGGTLTVVAGSRIDGNLGGQVLSATIEGEIGGDVDLTVARLVLAPGAAVGGTLRYESRAAAGIDPAAAVIGPVARRDPAARLPGGGILLWRAAAGPRFLAALLLGVLLVLLAPRRMAAVADAPRRDPAGTLLDGLGIVLFGPLALLVLALLVVTLPLAAIGAVAYLAVAAASGPVVGLAVGRALLRRQPGEAHRLADLGALLLGAAALALLGVLPVPFAGRAVAAAVAVVGFGAVANRRRGRPFRADERPAERGSRMVGLLGGAIVGILAVALALAAGATATAGAAGALTTASRRASFVWEVSPARLGTVTLLLALAAAILALGAWALVRRRGA